MVVGHRGVNMEVAVVHVVKEQNQENDHVPNLNLQMVVNPVMGRISSFDPVSKQNVLKVKFFSMTKCEIFQTPQNSWTFFQTP